MFNGDVVDIFVFEICSNVRREHIGGFEAVEEIFSDIDSDE